MGIGSRVFIVGGGTSLTGFDFSRLKNEDTIAVNYAAQHFSNPTYFITADSGVIRNCAANNFWDMPKSTRKFAVMKEGHPRYATVKDLLPAFDKVIKPHRFDGYIGFNKKKFATGKNTGFCALQLAVLLGYKEIYLLGFDLQKVENRKYWYAGKGGTDSPYDTFFQHFKLGLTLLKRNKIRVYSCSKISRLNKFIDYRDINSVIHDMPVFVSHYTKSSPYEAEVKNLIASLNKLHLDYDIEGIKPLKSWRANSNYCAEQVRDMLVKHSPRPILRLDADAVVQQMPSMLSAASFNPDVGGCIWRQSRLRPKGEFMGGTIYFGNTAKSRLVAGEWVEFCERRPRERNGDLLYEIIKTWTKKKSLKFQELPLSYCKIFDFQMGDGNPVIEHFQASRRFKKTMNRMGILGHA